MPSNAPAPRAPPDRPPDRPPDPAFHSPWHASTAERVLSGLRSTADGLSAAEAARRLGADGPNRMPEGARRSALMRFLSQFHNLLIAVLLGAAALSLLLGHMLDAGVIMVVVLVNATIGFVQEGRAEQALRALKGMIDPRASVRRDGRRVTVPADRIVRGDIVLIEAGDRVPADLRLLRHRNLTIDEAVLTGESLPVEKAHGPVAEDAPLGERTGMAYSGTFVASGQGAGVVVATGGRTELGRISAMLETVETLQTPLLRQMDRFARQLTVIILAVAALSFLFAIGLRDYAATEAFMAMVGIAVAAIPEGLPAILTITLAIGVQRMAARHAIIRHMPAVETLGAVSVICSDKTGTLTRNEMMARALLTAAGAHEATGTGYDPDGAIRPAGNRAGGAAGEAVDVDIAAEPELAALLRVAALCNDAELREAGGGWVVDGDPMEGALIALARKAGIDEHMLNRRLPRRDAIPFDAEHRFMATLHRCGDGDEGDGGAFIAIKGAPERILEMCAAERHGAHDRPLDAAAWRARVERLAAEGQRVLAFATRKAAPGQGELALSDMDGGATLLGCIGFIDPPRPEAVTAIEECKRAGIRIVMITGDHALTAREIARQLGLADDPAVLSGTDVDALDDEALSAAVRDTTVFARTTPEHKLRLVKALQARNLTVAMTGDGVNDAPALRRADVGIAMGRKGTEAAKAAAKMVLADDNFASIAVAVREGRTIYDNIRKTILFMLPTNGGEGLTIVAAILAGLTLPITPLQILWINMISSVGLAMVLAFEPTEAAVMERPPRRRGTPLLSGELIWRIAFVSSLFMAGAFGMFFWAGARGLATEEARTLVVNTIVAMEIFYLFAVRYVHGTSLTWRGLLGTPAVLIGVGAVTAAQFALTYLPPLQAVFDTRPLAFQDGLAAIGVGVTLFVLVEIEKRLRAMPARKR